MSDLAVYTLFLVAFALLLLDATRLKLAKNASEKPSPQSAPSGSRATKRYEGRSPSA